jgi:hypothetical protein
MTANTNDKRLRNYRITLQGRLDEEFLAAYCPPETVLTCEEDAAVLASIRADQSAILGLVRHLHNLGCTILALESRDQLLET